MLEQLIHNGILVPPDPPYYKLTLTIRGERRELEPRQEEMAIAWARKIGTEYVQDSGFCKNFMRDFSAALGVKPPLSDCFCLSASFVVRAGLMISQVRP